MYADKVTSPIPRTPRATTLIERVANLEEENDQLKFALQTQAEFFERKVGEIANHFHSRVEFIESALGTRRGEPVPGYTGEGTTGRATSPGAILTQNRI